MSLDSRELDSWLHGKLKVNKLKLGISKYGRTLFTACPIHVRNPSQVLRSLTQRKEGEKILEVPDELIMTSSRLQENEKQSSMLQQAAERFHFELTHGLYFMK